MVALLTAAWKGGCVPDLERRRSPRFALQQPVTLSYKDGDSMQVAGFSENASLRGALVRTEVLIPVGWRVEMTFLLQQEAWPTATRLHGTGRVVRVEEKGPSEFLIAIGYDELLAGRNRSTPAALEPAQ
jgi:PilZ domain-containing protein